MLRRRSILPRGAATQTAAAHLVDGQDHPAKGRLRGLDLLRVHLCEVLALQHLATRGGHAGVDLQFLLLLLLLAFPRGLERLGHACLGRLGGLWRTARGRDGRENGEQLLHQSARLPVDAKGLVENGAMFAFAHEDSMKRPVEIIAVANAGDLDGAHRIHHARRSDGEAGATQGPGEMGDVLRDASVRPVRHGVPVLWRHHGVASAASALSRSFSRRISSTMRRASDPRTRSISS